MGKRSGLPDWVSPWSPSRVQRRFERAADVNHFWQARDWDIGEISGRNSHYPRSLERWARSASAAASTGIRYYRDGRRHEESARTDNWEKARDLLRQREGDVAKGVAISAKIGRVRFEDAAKDLIADYTINGKRTLTDLDTAPRRSPGPVVRRPAPRGISTADIRAYVADRQKAGRRKRVDQPGTREPETAIHARDPGGEDPAPALHPDAEIGQRPQGVLRARAVRRGAPSPEGAARRGRDAGVLHRLADGERVLPLEWHQIDRQACVIRLEPGTTKNREGRVFQYARAARSARRDRALWARHEALAARDIISPRLFCRGGGQAIKSFYTRWDAACTAAGCPGRIPHDMRRTAVRNLNRAGVTETVAMKITGHKTRNVFDRYDITSEEDLAEAARKLQAMTGTISGTVEEKAAVRISRRLAVSRAGEWYLRRSDRGGDRTRGPRIKSALLYH